MLLDTTCTHCLQLIFKHKCVSILSNLCRPGGIKIALVLLTGYLYQTAYVSVYTEAREIWGHASPETIFEFDAVRWLLRLFWGPKHH